MRPKGQLKSGKRQASIIGMPTHVSHAGAKTEEDARQLIYSLMSAQSPDSGLPPPLIPSGDQATADPFVLPSQALQGEIGISCGTIIDCWRLSSILHIRE